LRTANAIYLKEKWNVVFKEEDFRGASLNNQTFFLR
jgi:hypothetical protein